MAWKLEGRHRNRKKMRSSRRNRSNGDNVSHRRNVDQAKAARAKAAIKAAKSQSPKSVYKNRKFKAAVDLETPKSLLVNIRLKVSRLLIFCYTVQFLHVPPCFPRWVPRNRRVPWTCSRELRLDNIRSAFVKKYGNYWGSILCISITLFKNFVEIVATLWLNTRNVAVTAMTN